MRAIHKLFGGLVCIFLLPVCAAQEQVRFTGNTTVDGKLIQDVLQNIVEYVHETLKCPNIDGVESAVLPESSIKRDATQPEGNGPATFERWTVSFCGKRQPFDVVFWDAKEGGTMYRVQLRPALTTGAPTQVDAASADQPVTGKTFNGEAITEDECQVLASVKGAKPALRDAPGVHVLGHTAADPLVLASTPEVSIKGLGCWRSEARLAPDDYLVPDRIGVPLFIKTDTGDATKDRAITLEKAGGSYRVRLLAGPAWSKAEEAEMIKALGVFNQLR